MDHLVKTYDQELDDLKDTILKMGLAVRQLIHNSIESLKNRDIDLAKEVIKKDNEVDQLELDIDNKCISMIAMRQPAAGDLRFITTAMRIATDLERIGDLAEDIAQRTIELASYPLVKPLVDIPKMGKIAEESLEMVMDAFVKSDPERAKKIWANEKEMDKMRDSVQDELMEIMTKDSKLVSRTMPLILISRHLERMGDQATNIAEDIVFMVEGKVIKHSPHPNDHNK